SEPYYGDDQLPSQHHGLPQSGRVATQRSGLRDERAALEWIRPNIASFGGGPTAMTLWERGFFMQSGTALSNNANADVQSINFTFVARNLGCDYPKHKIAELECMHSVPVSDIIENFVANTHQAPIAFSPVADEDDVLNNYTARYRAGQVAKVPATIPKTANAYASLAPYPFKNLTAGPNPQAVLAGTVNTVCGISNSSLYRNNLNISTFRYGFGGNCSDINPLWWMGAYYASGLAMMFGIYGIKAGEPSQLENETSAAMQDYVLTFVKDPINGPRNGN
ncbi:uncharacterized protein A1O5_13334, partial [Cladophialophora psammophila CBS 110553]